MKPVPDVPLAAPKIEPQSFSEGPSRDLQIVFKNGGKRIAEFCRNIFRDATDRLVEKISSFRFRRGKKSTLEKVISVMGWTNIVLLLLAILTGFMLLLAFMSLGWAQVLETVASLISGGGLPPLASINRATLGLMIYGTAYASYHLLLIALCVISSRRGVRLETLCWCVFSTAVVVLFTIMGLNFHWT